MAFARSAHFRFVPIAAQTLSLTGLAVRKTAASVVLEFLSVNHAPCAARWSSRCTEHLWGPLSITVSGPVSPACSYHALGGLYFLRASFRFRTLCRTAGRLRGCRPSSERLSCKLALYRITSVADIAPGPATSAFEANFRVTSSVSAAAARFFVNAARERHWSPEKGAGQAQGCRQACCAVSCRSCSHALCAVRGAKPQTAATSSDA